MTETATCPQTPSLREERFPFFRELPAELWGVREMLAVVAHPDDESFGLGGVLAWLVERGVVVDLLCFSAGEASTVGESGDLGSIRAEELAQAAKALGVRQAWLEGSPDGQLDHDPELLEAVIDRRLGDAGALVAFEPSGVTAHPDHRAVTTAAEAVADRIGIPIVEWGLAPSVAAALGGEMGAALTGMDGPDVIEVRVDRARQRDAIACHQSQDPTTAMLARRLELQGDAEQVRVRSAPFDSRLARFVAAAGELAHPDTDVLGRQGVLDLLIGFVAGTTWPPGVFDANPERPYGVHCLHDDPAGWTIATVVLDRGGSTPPHDHESWGAAATVVGAERNVRFAGSCPDRLRPLDTQLSSLGSGYVFEAGDIHQASDATGRLTVSVHLLVKGTHPAHQHCREPTAGPTETPGPVVGRHARTAAAEPEDCQSGPNDDL
jgi:LmbE family N-acetylglucosaminyl deacetylase